MTATEEQVTSEADFESLATKIAMSFGAIAKEKMKER